MLGYLRKMVPVSILLLLFAATIYAEDVVIPAPTSLLAPLSMPAPTPAPAAALSSDNSYLVVISAADAGSSKPNIPITGLVMDGPLKGQKLPIILEKYKTLSQLQAGDVVIMHGEVDKVLEVRSENGELTLSLKRTGIIGPSPGAVTPYTDYKLAN